MGGHVAARRGRKALTVKALSRVQRTEEKKELEIDSPDISMKFENIENILPGLARINAFPVTVRLALSFPISGFASQNVYKYLCGTVFGILTRSRSDWAKHVPFIFHTQRALNSADGVGSAINQLTILIHQKLIKHTSDFQAFSSKLAELILHLFVFSIVPDGDEFPDCATFASPVCQLMWMAESLRSCASKTSSALISAIDDQFTVRVSPYRGIKRSHPTTEALDSVMQKTLRACIGLPTTMPSHESEQGVIKTIGLSEFVKELTTAVSAVHVSKSLSSQALQIIQNFNSRHQKAVNSRAGRSPSPSFQKMIVRPWSDDVEIRAIVRAYSKLASILRDKIDMSCLYATVVTGAWAAADHLPFVSDMVRSAQERETIVDFGIAGEFELRPNWWRMLVSSHRVPSDEYCSLIASKPEYMTHRAATRIQAYWRASRVRHDVGLKQICEFVQNTGWPEFVIDSDTMISPTAGTSLTRASLMKLASVPKLKPQQERSATPASTESYGVKNHATHSGIETIYADHVACANLFFLLTYSAYVYRALLKYWMNFVEVLDEVSSGFAALLNSAPEFQIAHDGWSKKLQRIAKTGAPKRRVIRCVETSAENIELDKRQKELQKITHVHRQVDVAKKPSKPVTEKPSAVITKPESYKLSSQDLSEYIKFFDGDDSLLRDISSNCCESMVVPPSAQEMLGLIWLPVRASRFQWARAKLFGLLKGENSKAIFNRAEQECEFIKCITLLTETEHGSLNVLAGVPNITKALWIETVYHLIVGFIAQGARQNKFDNAVALVSNTLNSMSKTLAAHNGSTRDAVEAMIYDAAIGLGYLLPTQALDSVSDWYSAAAERYQRLGHQVRFLKCSLRCACVLSKQKLYEEGRKCIATALESAVKLAPTPIQHVLKINRSLLRNQAGEKEGAEVEIREVLRLARGVHELQAVSDLAEKLKNVMTSKRHESRKF